MNVQRMQDLVSQMRALAAEAAAKPPADPSAPSAPGGSFADTLKSALEGVNQTMQHADALQQAYVSGTSTRSLSDIMVAEQKADLSFQALLQTRNKLVAAYQDIMNIQA